jgi:hypothetical protein
MRVAISAAINCRSHALAAVKTLPAADSAAEIVAINVIAA